MITSDLFLVTMEVGYEAREKPAGDSFTGAIESVVEYEVRGEREVKERGGGFRLRKMMEQEMEHEKQQA